MTEKLTLVLIEDEPTFIMEDGTIIDQAKVGWVAINFGGYPEDIYYDKVTEEHIQFILDNNIPLEIEMVDTPNQNDGEWTYYESDRKPRLHKGKIIIHFK